MSDSDNLGKVSPWQIREFPESLREDIIRQAKQERVSVSEFVTGIMVAARDAGWYRESVEGKPFETDKPPANLGDLAMLVDISCKVADYEARMPKGTAALAKRLIKQRMAGLAGGGSRATPALPALLNGSANGLRTISGPEAEA